MRFPIALAALALTSCTDAPQRRWEPVYACVPVVEDIEDDERTADGISPQDALDAVVGTHEVPVATEDGELASAVVSVARGVGKSQLQDARWVVVRHEWRSPHHEESLLWGLSCVDTLYVPTAVTVTTDDGEVEVEGTGMAKAEGLSLDATFPQDPPFAALRVEQVHGLLPPPSDPAAQPVLSLAWSIEPDPWLDVTLRYSGPRIVLQTP